MAINKEVLDAWGCSTNEINKNAYKILGRNSSKVRIILKRILEINMMRM
jgi:hypothetical protein